MNHRRGLKLIAMLVFLLFLSAGCGGKKEKGLKTVEGNPETLYQQGLVLFNKRQYPEALKKFEELKSSFPDSPPYTVWSELKVGDCHFHKENYVEAIAAYEEFRKIHPTHEEITYVQYQIGMSYYNQMRSSDRDQIPTQKALSAFEYLIANYPPNLLTDKAKEKAGICRKRLADHQFNIGNFYYKQRKYPAASARFREALEKFPNVPGEDRTLFLLGKSYLEMDQGEKARDVFTTLVNGHPKSSYVREAKSFLERGMGEKRVLKGKTKPAKPTSAGPSEAETTPVALAKFDEERRKPMAFQEAPVASSPGRKESDQSGGTPGPVPLAVQPGSSEEKRSSVPPPSSPVSPPTIGGQDRTSGKQERESGSAGAPSKAETTPVALAKFDEERRKPVTFEEAPVTPSPAKEESEQRETSAFTPLAVQPGSSEEKRSSVPPPSSPVPPSKVEEEGRTTGRQERVSGPSEAPREGETRATKQKRVAALPDVASASKEGEKPKRGLLREPGAASAVDRGAPIDITSDKVESSTKDNLIVFKGNVTARQKDMIIYADSVEALVFEDGKGIEKVVADGNVKIQQGLRLANCGKAVFSNVDQRVVLTGNPKVWEGANMVSGDEIIVDLEKNRVEVKGGPETRGKATIQPGTEPSLPK